MVINQKMSENEMGYRGSKSEFLLPQPIEISVKEQRVDGSYFGSVSIPRLRCTLTGGESRYHIKFPSKLLNPACARTFSNLPLLPLLPAAPSGLLPIGQRQKQEEAQLQGSGQRRNVLNP
jgi:hypothetical protein